MPDPDPNRDPIHLAVGRGIEQWSWVETNLALLLGRLIRHRRDDLIGAAFHATVNFSDKLRMIDVVARRMLGGQRLRRWDRLHRRIREKAGNRNEIAHFSLVGYGRTSATFRVRLHPFWSVTKGSPLGQGLTAKQLEHRAQSFTDLSIEILNFAKSLPKRLRRPSSKPQKPRKRRP
jgi:hypothetical protein